jgi:23S rRNA (cytidine1920-2'-O)/16S rRNA (cytidine1409-2'-O)-methyltransferase
VSDKVSRDRIRLDQLLVQRKMAESREKARAMIMAGEVDVDGLKADKPGHLFSSSSSITLKKRPHSYLSRGGLKLEAAIDHFLIDVNGLTLLDIGASTGGFTDCLLRRGARKVIAVDVGYGQIHWKLRKDPRVRILEKTNARHLMPEDIGEDVNGAVIDVSFISLKLVVPPVSRLLLDKSFIVALIKPQFEAGKRRVGKGGVVRDPLIHREVIDGLAGFFEGQGWNVAGCIPSPILGPKGNQEFLTYMKRGEAHGNQKT